MAGMNLSPKKWIALGLVLLSPLAGSGEAAAQDYAQPARLRGTIFETDSGTNKILFTFQRTAIRSNDTVHVVRDFLYPDGRRAAREIVIYERGQFAWFDLDETQTGARGTAKSGADAKLTWRGDLAFEWTLGGKKKTDHEILQQNTLVGDMIPGFIAAHWSELLGGKKVEFRFIASSRLETVGFQLVKESEVMWRGQPAVRLRMEASNFLIARIVDPLFFIVEMGGTHRVLEYVGRTTPKSPEGKKWKDLDARTVYDWE